MRAFLSDDYDKRPNLSWVLLRRVWEFGRPYRWRVVGLFITILLISTISLISPLLFRAMIDVAIPEGNSLMITFLALGMMAVNTQLNRYVVSTGFIEQKTLASWIASNALTELSVEPEWPELGERRDEVGFTEYLKR